MPSANGYATNPFTGQSLSAPSGSGNAPYTGLVDTSGAPLMSQEEKRRQDQFGPFAVPHVVTFATMMGHAWRTYWMNRHDEAMRAGREEALAMKRDAFLMGLLQELKLGIVSLKWRIKVDNERDPAQKAVKDGLTQIVARTREFLSMRYYLLESAWYGRYGSQLVWEWAQMQLPDKNSSSEPVPLKVMRVKNHSPVNGDKIGFHWNGVPHIQVNGGEGGGKNGAIPQGFKTRPLTDLGRAVSLDTQNLRQRFVITKGEVLDADFFDHNAADAIHGVGIRHFVYWLNWLRQEWLANVSDWCERTGLGVKLWYYQGGNAKSKAEVTEAAQSNPDKTNILVPRFGDNAQEGVEVVDTSTSGAELLLKLMEHIEGHIERFVIGQTLSSDTEGSGLGGTGVADLHADTKVKILAFRAGLFDDNFTMDFVETIKQWTYPWADFPVYFVSDVEQRNAKETLEAVEKAVSLGCDFRLEDVGGVVGLPAPQEGDDTVKQAQEEQQQKEAELQMQQTEQGAKLQGADAKDARSHELTKMGLEHGHKEKLAAEDRQSAEKTAAAKSKFERDAEIERFANFNPNEARDEGGEWTEGGGTGEKGGEDKPAADRLSGKTKQLYQHGPEISFALSKNLTAVMAKTRAGELEGEEALSALSKHTDAILDASKKAYSTFFKQIKERLGGKDGAGVKKAFKEHHEATQEAISEAFTLAREAIQRGPSRKDAEALAEASQAVNATFSDAVYGIMDAFDEASGKKPAKEEKEPEPPPDPTEPYVKAREAVAKKEEPNDVSEILDNPKNLAKAIGEIALSLPDYRGKTRTKPPADWEAHKVYVADLYRALGKKYPDLTLDNLKKALLAANPEQQWLSRVDMPTNLEQDKASTIKHLNASFQTVNTTPLLKFSRELNDPENIRSALLANLESEAAAEIETEKERFMREEVQRLSRELEAVKSQQAEPPVKYKKKTVFEYDKKNRITAILTPEE